jgi:hypothetical protein
MNSLMFDGFIKSSDIESYHVRWLIAKPSDILELYVRRLSGGPSEIESSRLPPMTVTVIIEVKVDGPFRPSDISYFRRPLSKIRLFSTRYDQGMRAVEPSKISYF